MAEEYIFPVDIYSDAVSEFSANIVRELRKMPKASLLETLTGYVKKIIGRAYSPKLPITQFPYEC